MKLAAKATLQQHRGSKRIKINKELKTSKKQKSKKGKLKSERKTLASKSDRFQIMQKCWNCKNTSQAAWKTCNMHLTQLYTSIHLHQITSPYCKESHMQRATSLNLSKVQRKILQGATNPKEENGKNFLSCTVWHRALA